MYAKNWFLGSIVAILLRERERERNFFDDLVTQEFVRVMTIRVIKVLERCLNGM